MITNLKRILLAVGVSALALASSSKSAAESAASGSGQTYSGTVKEVDLNEHIFKVEGTYLLSKTFNQGAVCTYSFLDNAAGTPDGLHAGQKVTVSYQTVDGVLVASRVVQQPLRYAGYVKSIDSNAHTVTVATGGFSLSKQFHVPDDCHVVLRGNKPGTFADILAGNYVTLTYETPSGLPSVQRIVQTSEQFTGSLTAVDLDAKTVKAKSLLGGSKSFKVGDHCIVNVTGKDSGQLSDLKLEEKLIFSYDEISGVNVVNRIAPAKDAKE
jgi:predicted RNA-binding protein